MKGLASGTINFLKIYSDKKVARGAAALAYYITFSFMPALVCLGAALAATGISLSDMIQGIQAIVPESVYELLLAAASLENKPVSTALILACIPLLLTSVSAAFRTMIYTISEITGGKPLAGARGFFASFLLTFAFALTVYLVAVILFLGRFFATRLLALQPFLYLLRYPVMLLLCYCLIFALYKYAAHGGAASVRTVPGAVLSTVLSIGVSAGFSLLAGSGENYTLVYGSLASIMIFMLWIFTVSCIIFAGSILNVLLSKGHGV